MKYEVTVWVAQDEDGIHSVRDLNQAKIFDETATIKDILDWAKTIWKKATISDLEFESAEKIYEKEICSNLMSDL